MDFQASLQPSLPQGNLAAIAAGFKQTIYKNNFRTTDPQISISKL